MIRPDFRRVCDAENGRQCKPTRTRSWYNFFHSPALVGVCALLALPVTVLANGPKGLSDWRGPMCRHDLGAWALDCGQVTGLAIIDGRLAERDELVLTEATRPGAPAADWNSASFPYYGFCDVAGVAVHNVRSSMTSIALRSLEGSAKSFASVRSGATTTLMPPTGWWLLVDANSDRIYAALAVDRCSQGGVRVDGSVNRGRAHQLHRWHVPPPTTSNLRHIAPARPETGPNLALR